VNSIIEKPKPADAPSNLAVVGRYVLSPAIFEHLEKIGQGAGGEIQLTDGIAALMKEEAVYAHRFTGKRYDCGSKLGYLQATVEFALGHPQLGKDFGRYLQSLSRETINSIAAKGNDYARLDRRKGANGTPDGPSRTRPSGGRANGRDVAKPSARDVKAAARRKGATA
jgi:dTDP-glucose pyrophosphorylase